MWRFALLVQLDKAWYFHKTRPLLNNSMGQVALFISLTLTAFPTNCLTSSTNYAVGSKGNKVAGIIKSTVL